MASAAARLLPGERLVLETGRHWSEPARESLLPAGLLLAGLAVWAITPDGPGVLGALSAALAVLRWALLAGGAAWIAFNLVRWRTARVAVTHVRVLVAEPPIGRRWTEIPIGTVADVRVRAGFAGRRLGFGAVTIDRRPGAGPAVTVGCVQGAAALRDAVFAARSGELLAGRGIPAPAGSGGGTPRPAAGEDPLAAVRPATASTGRAAGGPAEQATRLARLAELHDRGLVTDAEFRAKKAEILDRI